MDTKSRKFDRTWITKTIAFLLAVVLFAFATVFSLRNMQNAYEKVDGIGAYVTDVLQGIPRNQVTLMTAFANENRSFQSLALNCYLYGDGSEQAYETYRKNKAAEVEAYRDKYVQMAVQNLLGESGHGSPAAIGWYLYNGYITLEKLADHNRHYVPSAVEVHGSWFEYIDANGDSTDFDTEYEFWSGNEEHTTTAYDLPDSDYSAQSSFEIPQSVQRQLKDGQVAVELCHATIGNRQNKDTTYDGYYALTLDVNKIMTDFNAGYESRMVYFETFDSYANFRQAYENVRKAEKVYKNMQFAVVDKDTGVAISNVADLDGKTLTKDDLRAFTKGKWHYSIDLMTEEVTYSESAQESIKNNSYLHQTMTYFLQPGVLNATLYVTFDETLTKKDAFYNMRTDYMVVKGAIDETVQTDLFCLLGILLCLVYLVIRAGRRHDDDELHMLPLDRIFTLLRSAANVAAAAGCVALIVWFVDESMTSWTVASPIENAIIGLLAAGAAACLLNWLQYLVRHIKGHTLFKNLFLVWLILKLRSRRKEKPAKPVVEYADIHKEVLRRVLLLGFLPNLVLGVLAVIFMGCELWALAIPLLFVIFGYNVWLAVYVLRYAYRARAGIEAVHRIRGGDYDVHLAVDEKSPALACFARDVNSINDGLHVAVSNAIKDERMRAELITNVSHDLKTPLTSIINYVDLLSRCDIPDETAQQYISVLTEKSARLKKLIEDLVEASKASSGAMRVDLVDMSLGELTNQIVGEYDDAFTERNLELIYTAEQDVLVRADSKLAYRVLDNLMSNVKKYAMPGTRVYLSLTETETHGVLTLRNVSQTQLNIPVEELLERFVRADESRSTEGSGLGLSIAQNLCELQGAALELSISGDLFTAEVRFPKA